MILRAIIRSRVLSSSFLIQIRRPPVQFHPHFATSRRKNQAFQHPLQRLHRTMATSTSSRTPLRNTLATSKSPYLRQHQDNPVAWQQWNAETLAYAREYNMPIFLSIGYSACVGSLFITQNLSYSLFSKVLQGTSVN